MLQPVQLVTTPSASGHSGPVAFAHLRVKFFNDFDGSQFRPIHRTDPPPLKWSDLRYVFDIKEDCNGKEAIQA